ncbi:unnamed protein product [Ambrosiozyma monospora]|uniref:Unnamed protein product n=1 Tax=Ambrosiozyma monospora TaxID=43982 RepID=A0ACB5SRR1_AMBMO|nr:unnamed protein product [Ambrosiozyma monospora]
MSLNQNEHLWVLDDDEANTKSRIKGWLKRSPSKLRRIMEAERLRPQSIVGNINIPGTRASQPLHRKELTISTPFDFNHVSHIDVNSQFGFDKEKPTLRPNRVNSRASISNGSTPIRSRPVSSSGSESSASSRINFNTHAQQRNRHNSIQIEPDIEAKTLIRDGDLPFQVYSGFKTTPASGAQIQRQSHDHPSAPTHTRAKSNLTIASTVSSSRHNSIFTRSTSMSTLTSVSDSSPSSPSQCSPIVRSQSIHRLSASHRRLASIPQEDESIKGFSKVFEKRLSLAPTCALPQPLPLQMLQQPLSLGGMANENDEPNTPVDSLHNYKLEKISIPSLSTGANRDSDNSLGLSIDPLDFQYPLTSKSDFTTYSSFNYDDDNTNTNNNNDDPDLTATNDITDDSDIFTNIDKSVIRPAPPPPTLKTPASFPTTRFCDNSVDDTPPTTPSSPVTANANRIKKVPSIGSPSHCRNSSFTFELDNPENNAKKDVESITEPEILLEDDEEEEDEDEDDEDDFVDHFMKKTISTANSDRFHDAHDEENDRVEELEHTLLSLKAAHFTRRSRLSMSESRLSDSERRKSVSDVRLSMNDPSLQRLSNAYLDSSDY